MGVEKTLKVLNDLAKKGLIERYVIGGGIAVIYYAEPVLTYDLDVFCFLSTEREGLITLSPIYEYLGKKGYSVQGEHVAIEGIPVQFIPAYNELVEEAVNKAVEIKLDMLCLENILERHGLQKKWREFRRRYDEE